MKETTLNQTSHNKTASLSMIRIISPLILMHPAKGTCMKTARLSVTLKPQVLEISGKLDVIPTLGQENRP